MDKNPATRITLNEIRDHEWLTSFKKQMPSKLVNCRSLVTLITEKEIENAVKHVASFVTVMKAVSKFKRGLKRRDNHPK